MKAAAWFFRIPGSGLLILSNSTNSHFLVQESGPADEGAISQKTAGSSNGYKICANPVHANLHSGHGKGILANPAYAAAHSRASLSGIIFFRVFQLCAYASSYLIGNPVYKIIGKHHVFSLEHPYQVHRNVLGRGSSTSFVPMSPLRGSTSTVLPTPVRTLDHHRDICPCDRGSTE